jgi:hypothetical protein
MTKERWPSGLRRSPAKGVDESSVGSNPTLSATNETWVVGTPDAKIEAIYLEIIDKLEIKKLFDRRR